MSTILHLHFSDDEGQGIELTPQPMEDGTKGKTITSVLIISILYIPSALNVCDIFSLSRVLELA